MNAVCHSVIFPLSHLCGICFKFNFKEAQRTLWYSLFKEIQAKHPILRQKCKVDSSVGKLELIASASFHDY